MLCRVLGLLVLPTVSLLAPGVSAGEGVVALGLLGCSLGVGAGAGVGVAVSGPGCGFGRCWSLGVAGRGRSPLLGEGLVGLPLCSSGVSGGPAAPLVGGCWVLVRRVFVCCLRLWSGRCSRLGVWCAFVGLVSVAAVAVCVVCARGRVCGVLVVRLVPVLAFLALVWRLCVGAGAVCRGPSPAPAEGSGCGSPPPLAGVCWWSRIPPPLCVPSPLFLFAASLGAVFAWCLARAIPAVVGGGGGP